MALPLAALAVASGVAQAGVGAFQAIKGARMKAPQSEFEIPEAFKDRLGRVKTRAATAGELPGQTTLEQQQSAITSRGISALEAAPSANFTSTVAKYMQQERDKLADIGIVAAERKDRLEADVISTIKDKEAYQTEQQRRKFEKEAAELAKKQALIGSGMQNIKGALDVGASASTTFEKPTQ